MCCDSRRRACSRSNGPGAPTCFRRRAARSWRRARRFRGSRYLEAQALLARCRTLFADAIAPFDLLLSASAPGEAPAGLDNTGEAMFNRWGSGLLVPCLNLPAFTGPNGLPVGIQLIGAIGDDVRLLRAAKWIAARVGDAAEARSLRELHPYDPMPLVRSGCDRGNLNGYLD